jgi:predicted chitinase/nucleoid-associated protein YgaU
VDVARRARNTDAFEPAARQAPVALQAQSFAGRAAPGTTDTRAWIPVDAPVKGDPSARSAEAYNAVIDQFSVDNNPRYARRDGNTYCNIFAWDVTKAMGAEIPHWVDGAGNPTGVGQGRELDANGGHRWLEQHGPAHGWREVSAQEAQALANQGHPTVASWNNPGGIGHIAVVRPGEDNGRGPAIAQAGASNFNNGHVRDSFGNAPVKYFVNDRGQSTGAPPATPPSQPEAPATGGSPAGVPGSDLQRGMQGPEVDQLQSALVKLGYMSQAQKDTGPGIFGPQTEASLKAFQADHGVPNTGYYGPLTREALGKALGPTAPGHAGGDSTYTVQPGDTLSAIAERHGSTVDAIAQANGITNPNFIQVGQQLRIPGGAPTQGPGPVTGPGTEPGTAGGVSPQQLRSIMPHLSEARAQQMLPHLNNAMAEAGINTPRRQAAFLAQLAHESGEFRYMEEIASGAAYEGRTDLGNTQPGDGVRFKGRGPIQLTGRSNYRAAGQALGIDLENNPTRAADPDVGFRTAAWFWNSRNLNSHADAGNFDAITYRVNGGYNGKASRDAYYARALQVLGG